MSTDRSSRGVKVFAGAMSGMLCGSAVLALLGIAAVDLFIVPNFGDMFADFDTEMPQVTILVMQAPRIAVVVTAILLAGLLVVKEIYLRSIAVKVVINLAALLLAAGAVVVLIFSLFMPLIKIMESLM
jgi:type II secretory pathway component PulF